MAFEGGMEEGWAVEQSIVGVPATMTCDNIVLR
jgi:hypothetical protein